jgi:Fe-S cluster assembly ATP-binding protein
MLTLKNLTVSIGERVILKDINYTFEKGKIYAIMGPNGSGKSTLASTVMGHPLYEISKKSDIIFNNESIKDLKPEERSLKGIFLTFQSPLSLSGVTLFQLLRYAMSGKMEPLALRQKVQEYAKKLHVKEELLSRSLNDGFSGGERKKMEVIQAAILNSDIIFFDEIDTGVDVDALRSIATFLLEIQQGKTFVFITHYQRILKYLKPDNVLIVKDGELKKVGDYSLVEQIEERGYESII